MPHIESDCIFHIGFLHFADTMLGLPFGLSWSIQLSVKAASWNFSVPLFLYCSSCRVPCEQSLLRSFKISREEEVDSLRAGSTFSDLPLIQSKNWNGNLKTWTILSFELRGDTSWRLLKLAYAHLVTCNPGRIWQTCPVQEIYTSALYLPQQDKTSHPYHVQLPLCRQNPSGDETVPL